MTDRRRGCRKLVTPERAKECATSRLRALAYQEDHVDPFYVDKIRQVVNAIGKQKVLKILEQL